VNLGQLIDPQWIWDGKPRPSWARREADPALVAKVRQAEAEGRAKQEADRAREAATEQRLADQQAEREAVAARASVVAPLRVPEPSRRPVETAPAPKAQPVAAPKPPALKPLPGKGEYGYNSTRILKVLRKLSRPQAASAICDLLQDIPLGSVHAFLSGFVDRQYAIKSGVAGAYKYTLGPRGKLYLDTFQPD